MSTADLGRADDHPPAGAPEPDAPSASSAPSEALSAWARAEADADARRRAEAAAVPVVPAPDAPPAAIGGPQTALDPEPRAPTPADDPDASFSVLSFDALASAAPDAPAGAVGAAPRAAATVAATVAITPVEGPSTPAPTAAVAPVAPRAVAPAVATRAGSSVFAPVAVDDDDVELDDDGEVGGGPRGAGSGEGRDPGSARLGPFWRWGFPIVILVLAVLTPVLVNLGQDIVLTSTDGRLLNQVTDPEAPGYQVITEPTPTLLLVQTDEAGIANGLTVMSLTGEGSGGMIFIPMTTVLALPGIGNIPLDAAAARAGLEGLQKAVEGVLGVGMAEVAVVDPQSWADLIAPLGSLEVVNPDDVKVAGPGGEKVVLFPEGPITLTPTDVAPYLLTLNPGENDLNRLVRHQAFWDAWLREVGTSDDPNIVPGESSSGLGRFVRELAADRVDMTPLPVEGASIPGSDLAVYLPVEEQVTSVVARLIPFPIGAVPGARPRVRLLDGTGTLDHGLGAVGTVVAAGGQVDQIGNADAFGAAVTTLQYSDDARLAEVERLRAGLGVGEIVKISSELPAIDVTIILGADYAAQPPATLAPVTTAVR